MVSFACEDRPPGAASPCPSVAGAVDPPLLAYLSSARAAHHQADLHENSGDLRAAADILKRFVDGGSASLRGPEVDEVMADTYARLADLVSQLGEFDAADRSIRSGLERASAPTYFRGHLWEVRGLVEQRRFKSLADKGDVTGAAVAKQQALQAFEEAIRIQQTVIRDATNPRGVPDAPPAPSARP